MVFQKEDRIEMKKIFFMIFFSSALCAQQLPLEVPKEKQAETEDQTVAKCVRDLESESPLTRQAAVLLLGKYAGNPIALGALIKSLKDGNTDVRRSALVSTIENFSIPQKARIPVLNMLDDKDVHIRRLASAALPYAFNLFFGNFAMYDEAVQMEPSLIPGETIKKVVAAFNDDDPGVRKNMISNLSCMRGKIKLPPESVAALLDDKTPEIKIIAIQNAMALLPPDKLVSCARKLLKDENRLVRRKLAETLKFSQNSPETDGILEKMLEDEDPIVRSEAITALMMRNKMKDIQLIEKTISDPETDTQNGKFIVSLLPTIGEEAAPLLKKIADSGNPAYRALALNGYFNLKRKDLGKNDLMPFLDDPDQSVRNMAVGRIIGLQDIEEELVTKMVGSSHADVRASLADMCGRLKPEKRDAIIGEFLVDESDDVRKRAIRNAANYKIPGYVEILGNSLLDDNREIVETAFYELENLCSSNDGAAREILAKFAKENPDNPLVEDIKILTGKKVPVKKIRRKNIR